MIDEPIGDLYEYLLEIINRVDDAVYIKSLEGVYLYINQAAADLIGKPVDKIIGAHDTELFPAEDLEQIQELDKRALHHNRSVSVENRYIIKGQEHWLQTLITPAYSSQKELIGLIGISRDISKQKHLVFELEKQTEELQIILNNSQDAIYRKDLLGRYLFINKAGADLMDMIPDQIIGHTDSELFGHQTTKKIRKTDREVIQKKITRTLTTKYNDDLGEHWFNVSVCPAYGGQDEVLGVVGISKDITILKKLEMQLREKNEQLLTILESSNDAIFAKDIDGKYLFVNKACEKFMGLSTNDMIGKTDAELFEATICETIRAIEEKVMQTKQPHSSDECFGKKGKESWYHATISPAYSSEGELVGIIGISRNMTDYHRTQEQLWQSESRYYSLYHDTPAIFLTLDAEGLVVEANAYGAKKLGYSIDELRNTPIYNIMPPEDRNAFRRHLQAALDNPGTLYQTERRYIAKDGRIIWGKDFIRVVFDQDGNPNIPILSEDFTDAKQLSDELSFRESHDYLTGLYNRAGFNAELTRAIQIAHDENINHVLYVLELDNFKIVNDACGHDAGDELLLALGELIRKHTRERDIVARLGGDEFAVLMENSNFQEVEHIIENVLDKVRNYKYRFNDKLFSLSASIGVFIVDNKTSDALFALSMAEHAVFFAKELGKNRIYIYDERDSGIKARQAELETITNINLALENDHFELFAQKIMPLQDDRLLPSFEILVRMHSNIEKLVSPGKFLPMLEQNHLAHKLDHWVIYHALKWVNQNPTILDKIDHISINISAQSLSNEYLLDSICNHFIEIPVPYEKICFEITETAAISTLTQALEFINALRNYGCLISLDDFGAGLSSFQYLRDLPVDFVKIDGAFIRNICDNKADFMLTQGIDDLVHKLGIRTVAEYVETKEILEQVKKIGIDFGQGVHIAPPVNLKEIGTHL